MHISQYLYFSLLFLILILWREICDLELCHGRRYSACNTTSLQRIQKTKRTSPFEIPLTTFKSQMARSGKALAEWMITRRSMHTYRTQTLQHKRSRKRHLEKLKEHFGGSKHLPAHLCRPCELERLILDIGDKGKKRLPRALLHRGGFGPMMGHHRPQASV